MLTVFIGLFFILLDLPIAVDSIIGVRSASSVFDLLADFVGYIIIYMGLRSLSGNGKKFKMAETLSWVMFGIGLVEWVTYGIGLGECPLHIVIILTGCHSYHHRTDRCNDYCYNNN